LKAVCINNFGSYDAVDYMDFKEPEINPDKVIVKVKASSINHLDLWVRRGIKSIPISFPHILGSDASGIIVDVGKNVSGWKVGDEIIVQPGIYCKDCVYCKQKMENYCDTYSILGENVMGVQAQYISLNPENIFLKPSNIGFKEVASMPLVFMTAFQMLVVRGNIKAGDNVLIYGATSGIGSAAIQIAKDYGAKVYSTAGSDQKMQFASKLGSDHVVNHNNPDWLEKMRVLLSGSKFDIIFEHIGKHTWDESLKLLNRGGRIVTCGATTGSSVRIDLTHLFFKQQSIIGSTMSNVKSFKIVIKKIEMGKYIPNVDQIFNFNEAKSAHQYLEDRKQMGKVVLAD